MTKPVSYIAIDRDEKAMVWYIPTQKRKEYYDENEYDFYEITSLRELYKTLDDLGYDYEFIEDFIEYRLSHNEYFELAEADYV